MTSALRLALIILALVLLLGGAVWYYLFGPNQVAAADLVPSDTVVFATIPNAVRLTAGYETSQLKTLLESPNSKILTDFLANLIGPNNLELLQSFLPNLSGQSFIAITHIDPTNLGKIGLIAGLKPKAGMGDFNSFVEKVKAIYAGTLAQGTSGSGVVEGLSYQWIQGPSAADKICVAQYRGWIVTAWGEASLRDWWERFQKTSTTPSLSKNADYQNSLKRVGLDSEAFLYADYHTLLGLLENRMQQSNPAMAAYLAVKGQSVGPLAIGTRFEHGEIMDRFSLLMPRQSQENAGFPTEPCAFDTLKFTSPDTRFYWASNINWQQAWKNLQQQSAATPPANFTRASWPVTIQNWAQSRNLDLQRNILAPLGNEISLQAEWSGDTQYPEAGIFVKLDKPADFQPTIAAFIDTVRNAYANTAVVNEIDSGGQKFATLKFVQPLPVSPTITEDGPYLGVFLTENQAVRSFKRDTSVGLLNNAAFKDQIGDRRASATQLAFLDSPQLLDRTYQTVLPYLPLLGLINRQVGGFLQDRTLPPDLHWLAPIGTWSVVVSSDDEGLQGYSISGIGNQGLLLTGGLGKMAGLLQTLIRPLSGMLPAPSPMPEAAAPIPGSAPVIAAPTPLANVVAPTDVTPAVVTPATIPPASATNSSPVNYLSTPTPLAPPPNVPPIGPTSTSPSDAETNAAAPSDSSAASPAPGPTSDVPASDTHATPSAPTPVNHP